MEFGSRSSVAVRSRLKLVSLFIFDIYRITHQLQLVVVAVANKHDGVENFFNMLTMVVNVVNASCKRKDMLRQSYKDRVQEAIEVTDLLSQALQKKDQDIVEAISLVRGTKHLLQTFRETGFDPLLKKMYSFYEANGIELLDMAESYKNNGRLRTNITNRHYYEFDIFNTVVDMQLQEFDDRFSEFNVSDLLELSKLYPYDFDRMERIALEIELNMYNVIVCQDERFSDLSGITELAKLMVDTKNHKTYPLVYRLLKLALVLPIATATVERCFSAMKIVKTDLRNKIGDEFLNDELICTIEKEALLNVTSDDVINQFQKMKSRRTQLLCSQQHFFLDPPLMTTYLYILFDTDIYMKIPEGLKLPKSCKDNRIFEMKDLGKTKFCLGLQIEHLKDGILVH
ncbi:hypothetical protein OSB04_011102 [Centaurea solstitialis]|uniref:HAT C-terminal dimerisation domain-containing protein n=1 Tax=Centaurea solstitialis TaxID=347529 RepID=A0AA38TGC3_9ASTR|nr:hypothetical protein OSB04_011102 [Centaurea solstitialis]